MSATQDVEITQELEALVAAKEKQQRTMRLCFLMATVGAILAAIAHRHPLIALLFAALAILGLVLGVRAHLRAAALRGQAMEKILAEAFRRAGQEDPKDSP